MQPRKNATSVIRGSYSVELLGGWRDRFERLVADGHAEHAAAIKVAQEIAGSPVVGIHIETAEVGR